MIGELQNLTILSFDTEIILQNIYEVLSWYLWIVINNNTILIIISYNKNKSYLFMLKETGYIATVYFFFFYVGILLFKMLYLYIILNKYSSFSWISSKNIAWRMRKSTQDSKQLIFSTFFIICLRDEEKLVCFLNK